MGNAKKYILISIIVNGLLPWGTYVLLQPHMASLTALLIATLVPLADNLLHLWKYRKLDAFGSLMLFTFVLTLALTLAGGSEKVLLMRESFITGAVGVVFLASLLLRQPLMFHLARKFLNADTFDTNSKYAYFGYVMRLMTAVWGVLLIGEAALRLFLVYRLTTSQFLAVSNVVLYGFIGTAIVWTAWYRKKSARRLKQIILQEG